MIADRQREKNVLVGLLTPATRPRMAEAGAPAAATDNHLLQTDAAGRAAHLGL
jgi:hypothetical protein